MSFIDFLKDNFFLTFDEIKSNFNRQFSDDCKLEIRHTETPKDTLIIYTDSEGREEAYRLYYSSPAI